MLCLNVLSGPSNPVISFLGLIGELDLEVILVLRRDTGIQDSLSVRNGASTRHQRAIGVIERAT